MLNPIAVTPGNSSITPIVPGFHPDPTVCRVGDDYYLATSSFEYFPAVPVFHSTDLLTWTQIGNILTTREQFVEGEGRPSLGVWAGTLRHRDGRFYYITTNVSDIDSGQIIVTATDPAGPWSEPVHVRDAIGIDPDICWDDDGTCLVTWHRFNFDVGGIDVHQAPVDPSTGEMLKPSYEVWSGSGLPSAEGPHLYRIGEWWYLLYAEGGTERGHCATVARARRPEGPYEGCPANPVLTRRSTNTPVHNTGHADLVQTASGDWAAVYLGVRPRGGTPGFHMLGRETFLSGIDWEDGWPVFVTDRYTVPEGLTGFVEDFVDADLQPRWVVPSGTLDDIERDPATGVTVPPTRRLCVRVRDLSWEAIADLVGDGSFEVRIDPLHNYRVDVVDGEAVAVATIGGREQTVGVAALSGGEATRVRLRAEAPPRQEVPLGVPAPDLIVLEFERADGWVELARLDGRYLSTEVASGFTGRVLAVGSDARATTARRIEYRPL